MSIIFLQANTLTDVV